ncbi:MAG: tyrosine-protein phosphatase [Gammaproteobacteria bacterium]|nr:tyrosine-protein phosphatase [Gammaproteobacteria bacterium]
MKLTKARVAPAASISKPPLQRATPSAALMARYSDVDESMLASPLVTADGVPYLSLAFARIEQDYGSVEAFLDEEVGVDAEELHRLRRLYLQ